MFTLTHEVYNRKEDNYDHSLYAEEKTEEKIREKIKKIPKSIRYQFYITKWEGMELLGQCGVNDFLESPFNLYDA